MRYFSCLVLLAACADTTPVAPTPVAPTPPTPVAPTHAATSAPAASAKPPAEPEVASSAVPDGYRVRFVTDGGEPSLLRSGDGLLHAIAAGGRVPETSSDLHGAPVDVTFGSVARTTPLFAGTALPFDGDMHARIVLLASRGPRAWFSVVESTPEMAHDTAAPKSPSPRRARLVERRSDGEPKVLAAFDSYALASRKIAYTPYEQDGAIAIVPFRGSLYAVAQGSVIVLDGPGADRGRFAERLDTECPADKRCSMLPAEISLPSLVGISPDEGSFVIANGGRIDRFSTRTGPLVASRSLGYQNYYLAGLVEDRALVLAHAGEPPFVARWSEPSGAAASAPSPPPLPLPKGSRPHAESPTAAKRETIAEGRSYTQLAKTTDGALYAVTAEGGLDRLAQGKATTIVAPRAGLRVVRVVGGPKMAYVVASAGTRPTYGVVTAE